jgi:hypothetical protein
MSRDRDIERVMQTWLRDGPSEMPDRVFDAVLDRVGRQPQRPLARARLRVRDMNLYLRIAAIAATLIIAVGAGYALVLRSSTPEAGSATPPALATAVPSAAPSAAPSAGAGAIPPALAGSWIAPKRDVPLIRPGGPKFLVLAIDDRGIARVRTNLIGPPQNAGEATVAGDGRITFSSQDQAVIGGPSVLCRASDTGAYSWSVSADGRTLDLEASHDDCVARQQAFTGSWVRSGCQSMDACLGDVPAGTYSSHVFDPWALVEADTPRTGMDGAVTYTVPSGWANSLDLASGLDLVTSAAYADLDASGQPTSWHGVYLRGRPVAAVQDPTCTNTAASGVGHALADLSGWIDHHPGLITSPSTTLTVDGHPATMLDIALDPSWTETCPDVPGGTPVVVLFTGRGSNGDTWSWRIGGAGGEERQRLILVDLGEGRVLLIALKDASTPSAFDDLVSAAMPIIESFRFAR